MAPKKELLDITKLTRTKLADILGITQRTIVDWLKIGFPRKKDKTYNLKACLKWVIEREREKAKPNDRALAEIEMIRTRTEKLQLEVQDKLGKSIPREKVLEMQHKQAEELMSFLTDGYKRNGQLMAKRLGIPVKSLPVLYDVWDEYIKTAMNHFVKGGKKLDEHS